MTLGYATSFNNRDLIMSGQKQRPCIISEQRFILFFFYLIEWQYIIFWHVDSILNKKRMILCVFFAFLKIDFLPKRPVRYMRTVMQIILSIPGVHPLLIKSNTMKKLFLLAGLCCLQQILQAAVVSPMAKTTRIQLSTSDRALAHFKENYRNAQQVSWYSNTDQSMFCVFHDADNTTRVFYDKKGFWESTLISYAPSGLGTEIRDLVLANFAGYAISYVNEVQLPGEAPAYVINIEDAKHIKVVRVVNGEIDVKEDFRKG
jgi:hypothetical protein